jgi:phosphoribosylformylglycinamidine cyclo-ligase
MAEWAAMGLHLHRHDVFSKVYAGKYPESYDNSLPQDVVYIGSKLLTDPVEGVEGMDAGKLVLSPTRTYAPVMKEILAQLRPHIHGIIHNSGGAQTKVLNFIRNLHIIKNNLFPVPPLFAMIQQESGTSWQEMYQVFNMGHRMEIYVNESYSAEIIQISRSFGIEAQVIGYCKQEEGRSLTVEAPAGIFKYQL